MKALAVLVCGLFAASPAVAVPAPVPHVRVSPHVAPSRPMPPQHGGHRGDGRGPYGQGGAALLDGILGSDGITSYPTADYGEPPAADLPPPPLVFPLPPPPFYAPPMRPRHSGPRIIYIGHQPKVNGPKMIYGTQ